MATGTSSTASERCEAEPVNCQCPAEWWVDEAMRGSGYAPHCALIEDFRRPFDLVRWASWAELHGNVSYNRNGEHWDLCGDGGEPMKPGCEAPRCVSGLPLGWSGWSDSPHFRRRPLWWHTTGKQQTASGYGSKLITPWEVECTDGRWRRVYVMCYSNAGTAYIINNGHRVIL